jgi:hypothetical protein
MKDKKQTESTKKQISASQKIAMTEAVGVKVYVYDLDGKFEREFRTLTECAEYLGSTPINVKVVADGTKQSFKDKYLLTNCCVLATRLKKSFAG